VSMFPSWANYTENPPKDIKENAIPASSVIRGKYRVPPLCFRSGQLAAALQRLSPHK
jgi:hypothetical protein